MLRVALALEQSLLTRSHASKVAVLQKQMLDKLNEANKEVAAEKNAENAAELSRIKTKELSQKKISAARYDVETVWERSQELSELANKQQAKAEVRFRQAKERSRNATRVDDVDTSAAEAVDAELQSAQTELHAAREQLADTRELHSEVTS